MMSVHSAHCCRYCGCKYGEKDCPVVNGIKNADYDCFECQNEMPDIRRLASIRGFALVPVEPTDAMLWKAAMSILGCLSSELESDHNSDSVMLDAGLAYKAMIEAAQEQK
jgi:hypothetical protein